MSLTVGHITYANCAPFFHHLALCGFSGEIVKGVPAELNRLLSAGELDLCPSSSIEYARHATDYQLLPDHSISSIGPVQSVLLFTETPLNALSGVPISITGESATSVALLQLLLKEFFEIEDVQIQKEVGTEPIKEIPDHPMLLIGDRALKARKQLARKCMILDLGELWYHFTGLPFVFALWIINRNSVAQKSEEIELFSRQLKESRQQALSSLEALAMAAPEKEWMGVEGLVEYWQKVSYDLDPLHIEGLNCFYYLLEKIGLIEKAPELEFFSP